MPGYVKRTIKTLNIKKQNKNTAPRVYLHLPCCLAGVRPPCRASSVSPPAQTSRLSVWSSSSELCGLPHHVQGFVSLVLWAENKPKVKQHQKYTLSIFCLSVSMLTFLSPNTIPFLFLRGAFTISFLLLFLFNPFPPTNRWFLDAGSTFNW